MNDLPERIFIDTEDGKRCSPYYAEKYGTAVEYIRADLAPVIGYTEQQMMDAMNHADFEGFYTVEENAEYLANLTPASLVLVPTIDQLAEAMYQDNTALLTNVEARYIAKVVHALLTKGRGGA